VGVRHLARVRIFCILFVPCSTDGGSEHTVVQRFPAFLNKCVRSSALMVDGGAFGGAAFSGTVVVHGVPSTMVVHYFNRRKG